MAFPGSWREMETPASLVDVDRVEANLRKTVDYCRTWNLAWRPHAKTHKSAALAREQLRRGAQGLTVATRREAEVMAQASDDLLLAYPFYGPVALDYILKLPENTRITLSLDSAEALRHLAAHSMARGRSLGVLVEIDLGLHRVGVSTIDQALTLATKAAETEGVDYRGILFYPGHVRMPAEAQEPALKALSLRLDGTIRALADAGLRPEIVSGGSTPTLFRSHEIAGLTEIRSGTTLFNDRTTALLGACEWSDCAYSVLATVVSTSLPGQVVVDAGSKALAKEEVNGVFDDPSLSAGFGCVMDRPELRVTKLSEEHGIIDLSASDWRPELGDVVRIVPNHVCVSVNLTRRLWQVQGERVLGSCEVEARRG